MLEMPLEDSTMPKSREIIGPSAEKMKTGNSGSNFLFGHGQLMNYATVAQMNEQPSSNVQSTTAICSSPLDQLIKLHERFQQGEFSTSTPAVVHNSSSSISTSKSPISVAQSSASVKTPPAVMNPASFPPPPTSAFDHFGTAFGCPQSLLDPSSLMFSSYTAANAAHHLGPTMVAAAAVAAAPWSSPAACWSWNAAANETTAALLNGGGGSGGSPNGAGWSSVASAGHHYFGNPFGAAAALVPNQFSTTTSTTQLGSSNSKNLTTMTSAPGKNGIAPKQTLPKTSNNTKRPNGTSILPTESRSIRGTVSSTSSKAQRTNGGGKMRATASGANGHNSSAASSAKMTCECPNCKELQRIGAPLDKKREKHSCHIPGCHKVYSRSSHLKAHLRWHSTDRPATTKRRLFDPPDGPLLAENLLRKENAAAISISQAENR